MCARLFPQTPVAMLLVWFVISLLGLIECGGYTVYRNVKNYGATGDGKTDDTAAIINALTTGRGTPPGAKYPKAVYPESTLFPAYVYFPPGTYLVTQTLPVPYYTQLIGDELNLPTIKFVDDSGIDVRVLEVSGGWYKQAPQENFFRQVRNFVVDMTECKKCTGLHWQVAQATCVRNVIFKCGVGSSNQGIWMENGSGGFMSDIVVEGGLFGLWVGNQQFTSRNITIRDTSVAAIYIVWDWVWSFKDLTIENTPVGIYSTSNSGSAIIADSTFTNCSRTCIQTNFSTAIAKQDSGLFVSNTNFRLAADGSGSRKMITNGAATVYYIKPNKDSRFIQSFAQGYVWSGGYTELTVDKNLGDYPKIPKSLTPHGTSIFGLRRPNFQLQTMYNVNKAGIIGDGVTDITAKLNSLLAAQKQPVLFFPHGTYIISSTVFIPVGTQMVGEVWSVLMANGAAFQDATKPTPMLKVGNAGDSGVVLLADFLLSTKGPQPGCVLLQWNSKGTTAADSGMWDVHFRVGGAVGTNLRATDCPKGDGKAAPPSKCTGVHTLMHATKTSSLYMENVWGWTADHDLDQHEQLNVYTARGFLCESNGPVWMYGTAMEHNALYQYNFYEASDVFMSIIQTETPYYQPSELTPFHPSLPSDPSFCNTGPTCKMAWALNIQKSKNILVYGTGLYSFFNAWNQTCLHSGPHPKCQMDMVNITSSSVAMVGFNTYGSVNMLTKKQPYAKASYNPSTFCSSSIADLNSYQ